MNRIRSLTAAIAIGGATLLAGCVAPGPYYANGAYPYYGYPYASAYVSPSIFIGGGYYGGCCGYWGRGYYGGYGRPGYWGGYGRPGWGGHPGYGGAGFGGGRVGVAGGGGFGGGGHFR